MLHCTFLASKAARHVLANGPALGAGKAAPERFAEPFLEKAFPKIFPRAPLGAGSESTLGAATE